MRPKIQISWNVDLMIGAPISGLCERLGELDKTEAYILYCAVGRRGHQAHGMLMQTNLNQETRAVASVPALRQEER